MATTFHANSPDDDRAMLSELGLKDFDALFADIPVSLQTDAFRIPPGLSEMEMAHRLNRLATQSAAHPSKSF